MKSAVTLLALSALFIGHVSFAQSTQKIAMRTDTIKVQDLRCGQCESRIHRVFKKTAGVFVDSSYADVETQTVVVQYDPALITRPKLEELIVRTGYGVGSTPGDATARKAFPSCCK
jgi:copper chaperone CopZ